MTQAQDQEIEHREELAATYRSRLRVLERQIAAYGIAVPAHIVLEKEQAEQNLAQTLAELRRLRPAQPAEHPPYLGLSTFQERDADLFFGREALVAELVERAGRGAFLAVLGASGSGKSSVVRAGLIPELRGGALPGSECWRYAIVKPGDRPLDSLAAALAKLQGADLGSALALRDQLMRDEGSLLFAARMLLDGQEGARLALVIDQAEELWTLAPTDTEARRKFVEDQQRPFIRLLLTAGASERSPVLVVLTMRADFLHRAAEYRDLARAIGEHDVIVSPMEPVELRQAIEGPAVAAGCVFEPGLVDELIQQVAGQPGALPLLEYTLLELWKARQPDGTLTWQAFKELGGVEGALAARAEAILRECYPTPERQDELRRILLRLVQPGEGAADTRRRALLADLVPSGGSIEDVQALLQPLADERLITAGRDPATSAETIEVAHEALIRAWPTFGQWIGEARADLIFQIRLEEAAKEWAASGERSEFLWSGLRLTNATAWQARARPQLNQRERRFLEASQAAQRRATNIRRWTRAALAGLVVAILAIVTGGSLYFAEQQRRNAEQQQRNAEQQQMARSTAEVARLQADEQARRADQQARVSRAGELAAQSQASHEQFPQRSLLLAVEALRVTTAANEPHIPAAEQALRDALANTGGRVLHGYTVAFSPDGRHLVTGSQDGTARLWNLTATDPAASSTILRGHEDSVVAVAFSPDGRHLVTGSGDGTARLWNLTATDPTTSAIVLRGHEGTVELVAVSPDGHYLVTGGRSNNPRLWDLTATDPTTTAIVLRDHEGWVTAVAFSPDGRYLVTGSGDRTVRLWNLTTPAATPTVLHGHKGDVVAVAFSPDGHYLVTSSTDQTARLWNLTTPAATPTVLHGHKGDVVAVAFSPDGHYLVTSSTDQTARLWDLTATDPAASFTVLRGHEGWVNSVAFSPDGRHLVTGSQDGTARLWDLTATDPAASFTVLRGHEGWVNSVAFSPDGHSLVTSSTDQTARLWDLTASTIIPTVLRGHEGGVQAVVFSPDGRYLLTGSWDTTARLWDLTATDPAASSTVLRGHEARVEAVAVSPDGRYLVTGSQDGTARLWNLTAADPATASIVLHGHNGTITTVAFSPDGHYLVTGSLGGVARLWDLTAADPATASIVLHGHNGTITTVAFSPDGHYLVTGSTDARLWNLTAADPAASSTVLRGHEDWVNSVAFSPDGRHLVTGSQDGTARLWDLTTADPAAAPTVLRSHEWAVTAVAFTPNGRYLVTGSWDTTARLWDLTATDPAASSTVLRGHEDWVNSVAFSADGRHLVTGSQDGTARLWDLTATDPAASSTILRGHEDSVVAVAFSPDGRHLVTGSGDGTAQLWSLDLKVLAGLACRTAGRNLSWEEWQQYFPGQDYRATCSQLPPHPSFVAHLVAQGADLAKQGKIADALAAYKDVQQRYSMYTIDADSWNTLCWYGSLWGQAKDVLDSCEQAVKLAPDDGGISDSRGLARALTGNTAGAIEDFNAFIAWTQKRSQTERLEKQIAQRQAWIAALQAGRNPFDQATLEALRNE